MFIKKQYEKPFIKRQQGGITNKFGRTTQSKIKDHIDGKNVSDLVKQYGSPLFVYSESTITKKYNELTHAFALRYPKFQPAWSYKTNYLSAICQKFHKLGSWAEVVSEMEYGMALKLGVNPQKIIFNGPFKPYDALKEAISKGSMVNIDSMDEVYDVEKIAAELGRTVNVGIRVNMALGNYMAWDRFGFNIESGAAMQAARRLLVGGKVNIRGLHCHVGTFILDPDIYRKQTEQLISFGKQLSSEFGVKIEYIDIGGGFASRNRLKNTYLATDDMTPSFNSFAEAVCDQLLAAFKPNELPLLIAETGRALIDEAGSLVATVGASKRLNNGTRAIILDAGVNLLFTAFWYDHEISPAVDRGFALEDQVIYGPLCMQIDVVHPMVKLPNMERGDHLVIHPVGAYNNTQWMQFIHLRPNVVMIGENGAVTVIREKENIDYLQRLEHLPE